jgi:hypothetical protein
MTKSRTLHPTAAAARIAPLLITLAGLALAAGGQWLWRHRRQIAAALVATAAATYSAGARCRQQIEALATDSAGRIPAQPVPALAPITATIAAAWGLVDRLTMARGRAPVAQPAAQPVNLAELRDPDFSGGLTPSQHLDVLHGGADPRVAATAAAPIANAYDYLELQKLLRPIKDCCSAASFAIEPIEPGEELLSPIRYRSSSAASAIEPMRFQAVVRVDRRRLNA